jgi:hypothetical protein
LTLRTRISLAIRRGDDRAREKPLAHGGGVGAPSMVYAPSMLYIETLGHRQQRNTAQQPVAILLHSRLLPDQWWQGQW